MQAASRGATDSVAFGGCAAVDRGPRCRLDPARALTLWYAGTGSLSLATARGRLHPSSVSALAGGTQYRVTLPAAAQWLRVSVHADQKLLELPLDEPEIVPEIEQAKRLQAASDLNAAKQVLLRYVQQHTARSDLRHAAHARSLLAHWAWNEGDNERAVRELRASVSELRALGSVSDAVMRGAMLAYVLSYVYQRHAEARAVLSELAELSQQDPASAAFLRLRTGQIALATGDFRSALSQIRSAGEQLERVAHAKFAQYAREQEAIALAMFGQHERAIEAQLRLLDTFKDAEPCRVADHREGVVWFALLAESAPGSRLDRLAHQYSALAGEALEHCSNPQFRRNHLIDAALLALQRGDLDRVSALLGELDRLKGGRIPLYEAWEHEVAGRYWLARGDHSQARTHFEQARALSRRHAFWENEYLSWLGLARAQRLDPPASLASYRHAEQLLDEVLEWVPASEGQTAFKRAHEAGSRELMELLLDMKRVPEALATARRARARVLHAAARATRLSSLDEVHRLRWEAAISAYQRERDAYETLSADLWRLPASEYARARIRLAEAKARADTELDAARAALGTAVSEDVFGVDADGLADDEWLVAYFPGRNTLYAFVKTAHTTEVHALPSSGALTLADPSSYLLGPLQLTLSRAVRLRLILPSELTGVRFEALTLAGAPLIQRFEVVYSQDVPARELLPAPEHAADLVVADPTRNLPASAAEGQRVRAALGSQAELLLGERATRRGVLARLSSARNFHFAGHAYYSGHDGLDSGLRLMDGAITVGEILALERGPWHVVLSACETSRSHSAGVVQGFGLAQAFVASGTRFVVATTRPVRDEVARDFFDHYYAALGARDAADSPVVAFRQAVLQLRQRDPNEWTAFRLLTP